jgi:hypothetical protein
MPDERPDNPIPLPSREAVELVTDVIRRVIAVAAPTGDAIAPELLTREQTARMLGVSITSFSDLEGRGFIGPTPIRLGDGRIIRYAREELLSFIRAGCPPRQRWAALRLSRRAG